MIAKRAKSVETWLKTKSGAAALLAMGTGVWAAVGLPAATPAAVGAIVLGAGLIITKLAHTTSTERRLQADVRAIRQSLSRLEKAEERNRAKHRKLQRITAALKDGGHKNSELIGTIRLELSEADKARIAILGSLRQTDERIQNLETALKKSGQQQSAQGEKLVAAARKSHVSNRDARRELRTSIMEARSAADASRDLSREALRVIRSELDSVAGRLPRPAKLNAVKVKNVADPVLSIAVPGYNRPVELNECLRSIVDQVAQLPQQNVEVWVTDDRSTIDEAAEVARQYALDYPFVGFRANDANLGLEKNLLNSCVPCRGEYIWILGNDDYLCPHGLTTVLEDLATGVHDVLLYAKTRIDRAGERELPATAGVLPPGVEPGESCSYDGVLDLAAETGLISSFGFISTLVIRRSPFLSVPPEPYLGLTMYPQLGVLLESSANAPMMFRNEVVVVHRTRTAAEKLAEAVGRREEGFMSGGTERDARWFGAAYAALLQRVIDRSDLTAADFALLPESLFGSKSMADWIAQNWQEQTESALGIDPEVEADAERFFSAISALRNARAIAASSDSGGAGL